LSNLGDIDSLLRKWKTKALKGVICGRAMIYSGDLDFTAAQARADKLREADDA